jgi:hypothetical protein
MPDFMKDMNLAIINMKDMNLAIINMKARAHAIVDMVVAMLKRTIILEEQTLRHCFFAKVKNLEKFYTCFKALPLIVVLIKQLQALGFYENNLEHL